MTADHAMNDRAFKTGFLFTVDGLQLGIPQKKFYKPQIRQLKEMDEVIDSYTPICCGYEHETRLAGSFESYAAIMVAAVHSKHKISSCLCPLEIRAKNALCAHCDDDLFRPNALRNLFPTLHEMQITDPRSWNAWMTTMASRIYRSDNEVAQHRFDPKVEDFRTMARKQQEKFAVEIRKVQTQLKGFVRAALNLAQA